MTAKVSRHHVIFLGAGASVTSGYPVGDSLRLRLSCRNRFRADLQKALGAQSRTLEEACLKHFERFGHSIDLFRNGGFSTVDEFSRLASGHYPEQSQEMKKLMRLALSFHNPEETFGESDYYPFVQRLFRTDDLHSLREDITVISYNYDCYLDFLLLRAYQHRQGLIRREPLSPSTANILTSGFYYPKDAGWTKAASCFNYYKLHGSIAYGDEEDFSYHDLFEANAEKRLVAFATDYYHVTSPPVIFPWELFASRGGFIDEAEFIFVKEAKRAHQRSRGQRLLSLYKSIWEGAKFAVERASKISFVGLSMHHYLNQGLAHLFKGKEGQVEVVVANPDNVPFKDFGNRLHPASPCGRTAALLRRISPQVRYVRSSAEDDGILNLDDPSKPPEPDITPRYSFREFIQKEMD